MALVEALPEIPVMTPPGPIWHEREEALPDVLPWPVSPDVPWVEPPEVIPPATMIRITLPEFEPLPEITFPAVDQLTFPIRHEREEVLPDVMPWLVPPQVVPPEVVRRVTKPWLQITLPEVVPPDVLPLRTIVEPFIPFPLPDVEPFPFMTLPDVLPYPETPVVVLPDVIGEPVASPVIVPWLPRLPYPTEPELWETFTPPYVEEDLLPLTPTEVPEAKAPSKAPLIVAGAIFVWASLTGRKKRKGGG